MIDGINAKEYAVNDLRSLIGYVTQKKILFSGDIAFNLNFGKEEGGRGRVAGGGRDRLAEEFILKKSLSDKNNLYCLLYFFHIYMTI